jgi:predicted porin
MHTRFTLAVLAAACGPLSAAAQGNVTLYGIADAAVAVENTGAPGAGSRKVLNSGNQSSSRLGFRGVEDLGDGLKAMFNLEAGIGLDKGVADSAFFGRRSVVGLEGGFGALTLGREYSPIASVAAATDILGQGFYGSNLSALTTGRLSRRLSNAVSYKTPSLAGFKASLVASAGEGVAGASKVLGAAAEYKSGPLYLGAGYHTVERVASGNDKEYAFGLGYTLGSTDIRANYLVADLTGASNKFEQFNVGVSYAWGLSRALVNVQQNRREGGAKGTALALSYSYSLSKRTNVYASYARLSNNALAAFGLTSSSTSVNPPSSALGADPSVMALGLRQTF